MSETLKNQAIYLMSVSILRHLLKIGEDIKII